VDQPVGRFGLEDLPRSEGPVDAVVAQGVARPGLPVGDRERAEVVLGPLLRVGDRLPQALGRGLDVDLEYLFHGCLQLLLEPGQAGCPGLGVLADPTIVDLPDRDGVQKVQLLAAPAPGDHEARLLEQLQVLHHAEAGHVEPLLERAERLPVLPEELVKEAAPGGVGEGLEHFIHGREYR
jgi:hypothetical protein